MTDPSAGARATPTNPWRGDVGGASSEGDGAADQGGGRAADPQAVVDLFDMHHPVPAEPGALPGAVAHRGPARLDEPLAQAGVEAAGDRVFIDAVAAGGECADLELLWGTTRVGTDHAYLQTA